MPARLHKPVIILSVLLVIATICAYFAHHRSPLPQLITAQNEFAFGPTKYPSSTNDSLQARVNHSYCFAMIMVRSHFLENNVSALESIRSWASENFQHDPGFLYPVVLPSETATGKTFIGSTIRSLLLYPGYLFNRLAVTFEKSRIAAFHNSPAFESFKTAYCNLFGNDYESALLLATYESERSKQSLPVLGWTIVWSVFAIYAFFKIIMSAGSAAAGSNRFESLRRFLGYGWLLVSLNYLVAAYFGNDVPYVLAGSAGLPIGIFLMRPVMVEVEDGRRIIVAARYMPSNMVAFAAWITTTFIAIQFATWIHGEMLISPNPLNLLIGSLTGNFLQESAIVTHLLSRVLAVAWVAITAWTLVMMWIGDIRTVQEAEEQLRALRIP